MRREISVRRSNGSREGLYRLSGRARPRRIGPMSTPPPPAAGPRHPLSLRLPQGRLEAVLVRSGESSPGRAPIVFLHDALGAISLWRDLPERLCAAAGRDGLVYDRLGYGRSDPWPVSPGLDFFDVESRQALPEVLRQAGVSRPILFGHSDGATIALLFAAAFPDVPAAIVAVAGHVFIEEETVAGVEEATVAWRTTDLPARLARHHGANAESVFRFWSETWRDPAFRGFSAVEAIRPIRCPLLVLQGEKDEYASAAQVEAIASAVSGPVRTVLLPGLGHFPHREDPERVIAETARFLEEHGA